MFGSNSSGDYYLLSGLCFCAFVSSLLVLKNTIKQVSNTTSFLWAQAAHFKFYDASLSNLRIFIQLDNTVAL